MHTRTWILTALTLGACGGGVKSTATPAGGAAAVTIATLERDVAGGEDIGTAHVRVPAVTVAGNPAATAAINAALKVPNTEAALAAITELGEAGLDYQVGYNQDGLLDVTIIHETLGAYPDSYVEHHLFDVTTGAELKGADVLVADQLPALAAKLDAAVKAAVAKARAERTDCISEDDDPYAGDFTFTVDDLTDVGVTAGGLGFSYDFDFPHAIQACEPEVDLLVPWAELATFLRPDGAVARIKR